MPKKQPKEITKKDLEKMLKVYMQARYLKILRYLRSDATNADKNVQMLIKHEPDFFATIQQIEVMRQYHKKEITFAQQVSESGEGNEIGTYLQDIRARQVMVRELIEQTKQLKALTPRNIKYKNTRIGNLENKLEKLKQAEQALIEADSHLEKRPRGRPRKEENAGDYYEEEEELDVEEE